MPSLRLNAYPKSVIEIYLTVLESDGEMTSLAHGVSCASLALADAGIEMNDIVVGVSGVTNNLPPILSNNDRLLLIS